MPQNVQRLQSLCLYCLILGKCKAALPDTVTGALGTEMKRFTNLRVGQWAGIVLGEGSADQELSGTPSGEEAIPPAIRRRMGRLERLAVRCTLGVLNGDEATDELVFCSRYGNLETLCSLVRGIAAREPMSPMAFSGSVHNAAPGLVGQIRGERLSHTALAAGRRTFEAGLIESYARLAAGESRDVTLIFTDTALPEAYRDFEDEEQPGAAMALRLGLADENDDEAIAVNPGRGGVLGVLAALNGGKRQIAFDRSLWAEPAP